MATQPKNGLRRGTTGYAINFFRLDILVNLQVDLKRLERTGFDESVCLRVRTLLSALVSAASAEPNPSFWGGAVHQVLRKYGAVYRQWNDVKGQDASAIEERDALLQKLQDIRHRFANRCRTHAHSLSEAHDLELISAINDALRDTITAVPGMFTALAKSAARFEERAVSGH